MKKITTIFLSLAVLAGVVFVAADHIDAPAVQGEKTDITDIYAFQSPENSDNLVLVANVQGLMDPAATASASFDDDLMIEFNIDNDLDNVEDMVIQCTFENNELQISAPVPVLSTGTTSLSVNVSPFLTVGVTPYGQAPIVGERTGLKAFAGPRDDPFFFDFTRYNAILAGDAPGFQETGTDTFAGTNVLSVVVEVRKSLLEAGDQVNVWTETKRRQ